MMRIPWRNGTARSAHFLMAFVVSLILPNATLASENLVVMTEQYYPFNYTEKGTNEGPIIGFATELVVAVLDEANIQYSIQMVPWARAMQTINSTENVIVYSMTRTASRESQFYWIGEIKPLAHWLFGLEERAHTLPLSIESAQHLYIGVSRAGVEYEYLTGLSFNNLVQVKKLSRLLPMLNRGRIDLLAYSDIAFGLFADRQGFDRKNYRPIIKLVSISTSLYIALSRQSDPALKNQLVQAYQNVRNSGIYDKIMNPLDENFQKVEYLGSK